jgi:hypothetical protein
MDKDEQIARDKLTDAAQIAQDRLAREAAEAAARVLADSHNEPSGRVTNRDLWLLSAAVNDRCSTLERAQSQALEHIDSGFDDLRVNMRDLRCVVNDQLHSQDEHIDVLAGAVETLRVVLAPMRARWDVRNALLKGSWKLTTAMIGAAAMISGLIVRFGPPWMWRCGM